MKKKILLVLLIGVSISFSAFSQRWKSEYEIIKAVFNTEKTNYVKQHISLTESEEKIFWPIYEDYEIDRAKYSGKRWDALQEYASQYNSISASKARDYLNDLLHFQKKELKLKNKYFNLLSNKLSPIKAAQFIELEEFINSKVKYAILKDLPYVE